MTKVFEFWKENHWNAFGIYTSINISSGVGVTKAPFVNLSVNKSFDRAKVHVDSSNHIHIWQMWSQLSCGDICQIWMWYSIGSQIFKNNGTEEIGLVTPTQDYDFVPSTGHYLNQCCHSADQDPWRVIREHGVIFIRRSHFAWYLAFI